LIPTLEEQRNPHTPFVEKSAVVDDRADWKPNQPLLVDSGRSSSLDDAPEFEPPTGTGITPVLAGAVPQWNTQPGPSGYQQYPQYPQNANVANIALQHQAIQQQYAPVQQAPGQAPSARPQADPYQARLQAMRQQSAPQQQYPAQHLPPQHLPPQQVPLVAAPNQAGYNAPYAPQGNTYIPNSYPVWNPQQPAAPQFRDPRTFTYPQLIGVAPLAWLAIGVLMPALGWFALGIAWITVISSKLPKKFVQGGFGAAGFTMLVIYLLENSPSISWRLPYNFQDVCFRLLFLALGGYLFWVANRFKEGHIR
jgi:hypothetical protein